MAGNPETRYASAFERARDNVAFFLRFVSYPRRIGAPLPSSARIADTIRRELAERGARRVVELARVLKD